VKMAVTNNPATSGRILGRVVFMMMLPFPWSLELPNGLELSCPAAQATLDPFSRNLAGKSRSNLPHASRVSCSELLGGDTVEVACNHRSSALG
jgi:hypothetical protein